jgi:hypothetical protein
MKENTERNGGAYYAELTKAKCTHLVAASADSEKYRHASRWRSVKIVTPAWFKQSIAAKRALELYECLLAAPPFHEPDDAQCALRNPCIRCTTRTMLPQLLVRFYVQLHALACISSPAASCAGEAQRNIRYSSEKRISVLPCSSLLSLAFPQDGCHRRGTVWHCRRAGKHRLFCGSLVSVKLPCPIAGLQRHEVRSSRMPWDL